MTPKEWGRQGGQATRGEQKGTAKLTEADVREIRTSAERYSDLAERYHIHWTNARKIKRRETWKHLDD